MWLRDLVATSAALAATRSRKQKVARLAGTLRALAPDERRAGAAWLAGYLPEGRIGVGWAAVSEAMTVAAAPSSVSGTLPPLAGGGQGGGLTIAEVARTFAELAAASGKGSAAVRRELLGRLFAAATADERDFLARLLGGELRQGAAEGMLLDAIAEAAQVPAAEVRRAVMCAGDPAAVAEAALGEGRAGLDRFHLVLFRPLLPMLAQTAGDVDEALAALGGDAILELKLDGARIQVHKLEDEVRVYSRGLHEVTASVPEVVAAVAALPARSLVLDGEAIALRPDGSPHPFQTTMRRFGTRVAPAELPLQPVFFDILHLDGDDLLTLPAAERDRALENLAPAERVVRRLRTGDAAAAAGFWRDALERGHEGLMAKSPASPYEAGCRGAGWLKIKPAHTLDLVVLAVEWGSGRRRGWLSNLHLGARDPQTGGFVMLGKTFKGMTDAMLAWQTEKLLALEIGREGHIVHVRPELVVEIAFDGVQASTQYPGGMALRFARVKRYRQDKTAAEADTIATVRAIFTRGHT